MAQVKYRAVARVGEYQKDGQTKARWQEVGAVMATDKGHILLLEPWFNPAGLPRDGDKAVVSLFEPDQEGRQGSQKASDRGAQGPSQDHDDDSSIPF